MPNKEQIHAIETPLNRALLALLDQEFTSHTTFTDYEEIQQMLQSHIGRQLPTIFAGLNGFIHDNWTILNSELPFIAVSADKSTSAGNRVTDAALQTIAILPSGNHDKEPHRLSISTISPIGRIVTASYLATTGALFAAGASVDRREFPNPRVLAPGATLPGYDNAEAVHAYTRYIQELPWALSNPSLAAGLITAAQCDGVFPQENMIRLMDPQMVIRTDVNHIPFSQQLAPYMKAQYFDIELDEKNLRFGQTHSNGAIWGVRIPLQLEG